MNYFTEYAADTYRNLMEGIWKTGHDMIIDNGRPIIGGFYYLWGKLGLDMESLCIFSYFLAIIFMICSVFVVSSFLNEFISNELLIVAVAFISVANVFVIEYFLFMENGAFIFAIFLDTLATLAMINFYKKKKVIQLIIVELLLLISIFTYQPIGMIFLELIIPFTLYYADGRKKWFFLS